MNETQTSSGTIAGYFENHSDAERAIQELRDAGFTSAHIGVAHSGSSAASGTTSGSSYNSVSDPTSGSDYNSTSGSSSSTTTTGNVGQKAEGVWDRVKNFFEGDPEPYADERSQGDLANREVTANPADSYGSSQGYGSSDLHGTLSNLSVPEDRSRYLGHRFGSGQDGAVVTVNAGTRASEAETILRRCGADLGENAGSYDYSAAQTNNTEGAQNIQLLGEILRVQKERVSRGEVTIRKEVITENQTVQVPVTREELVIERHAVDGNTPATGNIGDTGTIRIPLTEETASIDKSTVVREEVAVGKKPVQEVRDLSGEVRHEELVVDDATRDVSTTGRDR